MNAKIAQSLLRQRDPKQRRWMMLKYGAALVLLFFAHDYFTELSSPLKLVPQMISAMFMGWMLICLLSVKNFPRLAGFIDWDKVTAAAGNDPSAPASQG